MAMDLVNIIEYRLNVKKIYLSMICMFSSHFFWKFCLYNTTILKAVKELVAKNVQGKTILDNLHSSHKSKNGYDDDESIKEYYPNRKFWI